MARATTLRQETLELEQLRIVVAQRVVCRELQLLGVEVVAERMRDFVMVSLQGYLWGKQELKVFRWPASWWQAVKERWMPLSLRKRYPVRYKTIEIRGLLFFPTLNVEVPNHHGTLVIETQERIDTLAGDGHELPCLF